MLKTNPGLARLAPKEAARAVTRGFRPPGSRFLAPVGSLFAILNMIPTETVRFNRYPSNWHFLTRDRQIL